MNGINYFKKVTSVSEAIVVNTFAYQDRVAGSISGDGRVAGSIPGYWCQPITMAEEGKKRNGRNGSWRKRLEVTKTEKQVKFPVMAGLLCSQSQLLRKKEMEGMVSGERLGSTKTEVETRQNRHLGYEGAWDRTGKKSRIYLVGQDESDNLLCILYVMKFIEH